MALSAEKILMIGVGALGAYAVYRLVIAPKDQETPPGEAKITPKVETPPILQPTQPTQPTQPALPLGPLPAKAGPIGVPPPAVPLVVSPTTGPIAHLTNSRAYRGRLELPPGSGTTPELVQAIVRSMGFDLDTIHVFSNLTEAALNIPAFALENPGQGTRWFHARMLGPTVDAPRPSELIAMWIVSRSPIVNRPLPPAFVSGYGYGYV